LKLREFDVKTGLEQLVRRIADERGDAEPASVVRLSGELPVFVRSEPIEWQRCLRTIERWVRACPERVELHIDKRSEETGKECLHLTIRSKSLEMRGDVRTMVFRVLENGSGTSCCGAEKRGGDMGLFIGETSKSVQDCDPERGELIDDGRVYPDNDRKLQVLLAEDNPPNRFVAQTYLEKNGYGVLCAENGEEVLELLQIKDIDIVLMDIQMPVMDGLEATRRIRKGLPGVDQTIPIVALTAYAMKGDRERFLRNGMDEYMSKPVDFLQLFHVIDRLVRNRERAGFQEENH
jgi:CheY-like chemotaxis protein